MPDARTIEIPAVTLGRLLVTIAGETPLITNRFGERARAAIEAKQQGTARVARPPPPPPEAEFRDALYVLGEGRYGLCPKSRFVPRFPRISSGSTRRAARNPDSIPGANRDFLGKARYGFPSAGVKKALVAAGGRFAGETMIALRGQ